ncbi:MAG: hydrogenase maturation protease [Planctomycetota bacterium]
MLIAGIGSCQGIDSLGWRVIDELAEQGAAGITLLKASQPADLFDELLGQDSLLVVDACQSGASFGTLHRLTWPDDRLRMTKATSSHGIDVEATLQLAAELGILPARTALLLAEIGSHVANVRSTQIDCLAAEVARAASREIGATHHA